jgi:hypothetical protein
MRLHAVGTHNLVLGFVALRLEVEVVIERVVAALANSGQDDGHVKLTPTLLVDAERRLLDCCWLVSDIACRRRVAQGIVERTHCACSSRMKDAGCKQPSRKRWA